MAFYNGGPYRNPIQVSHSQNDHSVRNMEIIPILVTLIIIMDCIRFTRDGHVRPEYKEGLRFYKRWSCSTYISKDSTIRG